MSLEQFYQKYSGFTHSIAAVFASLIVAYNAVPEFHQFVQNVYNTLSKPDQAVITTAIALYIWYRNGQKPAPIPNWKKRQLAKQKWEKTRLP
jgi:hypothetical protein